MLTFDSDFSHAPQIFNKAYAPFLAADNGAYAYFSLNFDDIAHAENEAIAKGVSLSIGTTNISFLLNYSYFVFSCHNYHCIAKQNFSLITIRESYLRHLTHNNFLRFNEVLYQVARFRALYLDMLVLHASAVVYQDEVLLFSGMKGAGKSTQARLWLENTDAWVLNYDKPVAGLAGERVMISGSPWGGKEDLSINEVRPAKALFFVHQAKENRVERLSPAKAYSQAYLNYFVYPLNQDLEDRYHHAITQLVQKVPVYDLYCTDTAQAVEAVKHALYQREE